MTVPEVFDLDVAREERAKARAEAGWVAPVLRFGGVDFALPDEMPADVLYGIIDGNEREALRVLLDGQYEQFWALGPARDDIPALISWIVSTYNREGDGRSARARPKPARPKPAGPSKRVG